MYFLLATIPLVIAEDMLVGADLGHMIPYTLPLAIEEQELILNGEVDICITLDTIPPITKVNMLDCQLFQEIMLIVIR